MDQPLPLRLVGVVADQDFGRVADHEHAGEDEHGHRRDDHHRLQQPSDYVDRHGLAPWPGRPERCGRLMLAARPR